jgi:ABC-type multidrug transport system fused ATPase/permease subunit
MKNTSKSEVSINGSIAYCSQVPWIMNDTVKNNILFGKEFNKIKYEQAIVYASL